MNNDPLRFPPTTHLFRLVPKSAFYQGLDVKTRMRQRFVDDVEQITWAYKLAPTTLNVADGAVVHEIAVFLVRLKGDDAPDDIFRFIDEQLPRHALFILVPPSDTPTVLLCYKRPLTRGTRRYEVLRTFRRALTPDLRLRLDGPTMDDLYESLAGQLSQLGTRRAADTQQALALIDDVQRLQRQADSLRSRIRRERQYNKKFELHQLLRQAEQHLDDAQARLQHILHP